MTDRTVSVIVAIYNVSKYLDRCVLSICEQTCSDLQIILINDGSTDDSLEKCLEWKKKDPIKKHREYLIENKIATDEELDAIIAQVKKEVEL